MKPLALALAVTATVVVAACGGDGDTTTVTTQGSAESPAELAQAKEEFISQADEICTDYRQQLEPLNMELDDLRSASPSAANDRKAAELFDQAAELLSEEFDKLQALSPPPGDEVVLDRYFQAALEAIDLQGDVANALRNQDAEEFERLSRELDVTGNRAQGLAQGYGFTVCGSD